MEQLWPCLTTPPRGKAHIIIAAEKNVDLILLFINFSTQRYLMSLLIADIFLIRQRYCSWFEKRVEALSNLSSNPAFLHLQGRIWHHYWICDVPIRSMRILLTPHTATTTWTRRSVSPIYPYEIDYGPSGAMKSVRSV